MRRAGHGGAGGLAAAVAVARRDLLEFVRDRRTLCIALLMPMAMYPLIALMSTLGARTAIEDLEARTAPRRLALAVSGADAEPFVSLLRAAVDVAAQRPHPLWPAEVVLETVAEAEGPASLESGRSDVWLHVGPGTAQDLEGQGTVRLTAQVPQGRALDNRIRDHFEAVMLRVLTTAAPADVLLGLVMRGCGAHFQEKVMTSSRLPAADQRVSLRASRPSGSISSVRAVSGVFCGQVALRKTSTPSWVAGSTAWSSSGEASAEAISSLSASVRLSVVGGCAKRRRSSAFTR